MLWWIRIQYSVVSLEYAVAAAIAAAQRGLATHCTFRRQTGQNSIFLVSFKLLIWQKYVMLTALSQKKTHSNLQ